MQIVSNNLHQMPNCIFWEKKENVNSLSAEFAHKVVKVNIISYGLPTFIKFSISGVFRKKNKKKIPTPPR